MQSSTCNFLILNLQLILLKLFCSQGLTAASDGQRICIGSSDLDSLPNVAVSSSDLSAPSASVTRQN